MKAVADTLAVARSNLIELVSRRAKSRRPYRKAGDNELLALIRRLVDDRLRPPTPQHIAPSLGVFASAPHDRRSLITPNRGGSTLDPHLGFSGSSVPGRQRNLGVCHLVVSGGGRLLLGVFALIILHALT